MDEYRYSVAHGSDGPIYVGTGTGVRLITEDGGSFDVVSTNTHVYSVCVSGDIICTFGSKGIGSGSVNFYNTQCQLIYSWELRAGAMAARGDSLVICDGETVAEYNQDGLMKGQARYQELQGFLLSPSAMSQSDDVIVIDSQQRIHRLSVTTGRCVWTNDSLPESTAVCCDEADKSFRGCGELERWSNGRRTGQ